MARNGTAFYMVELIGVLDFDRHYTVCTASELADLINDLDERYVVNNAECLDGNYTPNYQEFKSSK